MTNRTRERGGTRYPSDLGPLRGVALVLISEPNGYRTEVLLCGHTVLTNPHQAAERRRCGECRKETKQP